MISQGTHNLTNKQNSTQVCILIHNFINILCYIYYYTINILYIYIIL